MNYFLVAKNIECSNISQSLLQKLFGITFEKSCRSIDHWSLIFFRPMRRNCRVNEEESDFERHTFLANYNRKNSTTLRKLARDLETNPETTLYHQAAPFCALWLDDELDSWHIQVDALGLSPVYEYRDESHHIISNHHLLIEEALGRPLQWDKTQVVMKAFCQFLPNDAQAAFKNMRFLGPGERLSYQAGVVQYSQINIISQLIDGEASSCEESLKMADKALERAIFQGLEIHAENRLYLSGGHDSRLIASYIVKNHKLHFSYINKSLMLNPDYFLTKKLERLAAIKVQYNKKEQKRLSFEQLQNNSSAAIKKLSLFSFITKYSQHDVDEDFSCRFSRWWGWGGEVSQLYSIRKIKVTNEQDPIDQIIANYMAYIPPTLADELRMALGQQLLAMKDVVDHYVGTDQKLKRVRLFELLFFVRKMQGLYNIQTPEVDVMPLLDFDYIKALFSLPLSWEEYLENRWKWSFYFHKSLINKNMPKWRKLPFAADLLLLIKKRKFRIHLRPTQWMIARLLHFVHRLTPFKLNVMSDLDFLRREMPRLKDTVNQQSDKFAKLLGNKVSLSELVDQYPEAMLFLSVFPFDD